MTWFLLVLKKYAVFTGRAHRTEFWMFNLIALIIYLALTVVELAIGIYGEFGGPLTGLFSLAVLIPSFAVGARRLHDVGRSGWWQLIFLIPIVGMIILIVWWATKGKPEPNEWGANPWVGVQPA